MSMCIEKPEGMSEDAYEVLRGTTAAIALEITQPVMVATIRAALTLGSTGEQLIELAEKHVTGIVARDMLVEAIKHYEKEIQGG